MDFSQFVASGDPAMTQGAVLERVRRDTALELDPHILHGGLIYDPAGRAYLADLHRGYIQAALMVGLPILTFTDTWRCSHKAVEASAFKGRPVNEDSARFMNDLRAEFAADAPIFVGGSLGPSGDAYDPADSLTRREAREFHRPQVEALAASGVDFLNLATAPNVEEALGAADAMADTGLPYLVSFVIRRTGVVLDGTPLGEAMERIDTEARHAPVGFAVNCVHARVLEQALAAETKTRPGIVGRLLTFQGNTADLEVEELNGSEETISEPAEVFADSLCRLRDHFGLRILGGCCGTEADHIQALATRLTCQAA